MPGFSSASMIFSDLGIVTTTADNGPALTRALLTALAKDAPDVIVLELGDGLLGAYGVEAILSDESIRDFGKNPAIIQ